MTAHPLLRPGTVHSGPDDELRVLWLTAVHESLRPTAGRVIGEVRKPTVGRNHYAVDVQFDRTVRAALLLNPAGRLVALVEVDPADPIVPLDRRRYLPVPAPEVFRAHGFTVAHPADLERDLTPADVVDLTAGERRDIDYHRPSQLGEALFNWFD